jgi:hypothetical protein
MTTVELHRDAAGRATIQRDGQQPVRLRSVDAAADWLAGRGVARTALVLVEPHGARLRWDGRQWAPANTQAQWDAHQRAQIDRMLLGMARLLRRLA